MKGSQDFIVNKLGAHDNEQTKYALVKSTSVC